VITSSASSSALSQGKGEDAPHDDTPLSIGRNAELLGVPRLLLELGAAELGTMLAEVKE
jgi:hypothetical protein